MCGRCVALQIMHDQRIRGTKQICKTRAVATADIADYIDSFYNPTRRHSYLAGVRPDQFEAAHKRKRLQ